MNQKIVESKVIHILTALCFLVYFTSYVTRINYTAIISEIIQEEGILKSTASIVTMVSFISYGIGQLISGYIGDRMPPKLLILGGLLISSALNILMPVVGNIEAMAIIWFLNGFAQALIWPPMVRILSAYLKSDDYNNACVTVMIASSLGTIAVYLLSPLIISISSWKAVFWIAGIIGISISLIWIWGANKIEQYVVKKGITEITTINSSIRSGTTIRSLIIPSGFIFIIMAIILQGTLKDGVTTWMPSYLIETFQLKSSVSIFSTVVLPVFSIFCLKLTAYIQRRYIKNELICSAIIFFTGFAASIALSVFSSYHAVVSIILAAIITGCMFGVNLILIGLIPNRFEHTGKVAYISGIMNFFTYVGSALSSYGIAKISENYGWQFTITSWAVIALLGACVCFLCAFRWKKFCK